MYSPPYYTNNITSNPINSTQFRQIYPSDFTQYPSNTTSYQPRHLSYSPMKKIDNSNINGNNYPSSTHSIQGTSTYAIPNNNITINNFNEYGQQKVNFNNNQPYDKFQQSRMGQTRQSEYLQNQSNQNTQKSFLQPLNQPQVPTNPPFYYYQSNIQIKYDSMTTYNDLLKNEKYDQQIKTKLARICGTLLIDKIFIFAVSIQPENINCKIWKHPSQILRFIKLMQKQINIMQTNSKKMGNNGHIIVSKYYSLKNVGYWSQSIILVLVQFLNLLSKNPYLRKSVIYLTFVQHCMPLFLWNMKVYQQVPIYYDTNFISKLFHDENQIIQYLTVTSQGIIISTKNPMETKVDQMVPFTNQFQFNSDIDTDNQLYFNISSCTHQNIQINFKKNYVGGLNFHIGTKYAYFQNFHSQKNRFQSFSKPRKNCWAKLYNDGQGYFQDLYNELKKARKQVCITDWWMTPYFLLKRDTKDGPVDIHDTTKRLDGVLKSLGDRGVKIFIMLFRQPLGMLCTDSFECQLYLQSLSRNIRIKRHPIFPQLWSHHQKCVIIDQKVGFMGGLDICYGRWDTPQHHLLNYNNYWDGGDYTNQRLRAYTPGKTVQYTVSPVDRKVQARMPWHDIGMQHRGDSVIDSMRHFIQYWYFVGAEAVKDPYFHLRNLRKRYDRATHFVGLEENGQKKASDSSCGSKVQMCGVKTKLFFTGTQKRWPQLLVQGREGKKKGGLQLQLCRSADTWSIGARNPQQSIHNAYQTLIQKSQHFIYIQNQFFMGTQNKIVQCMAKRIQQAHLRQQNFKIIVVMPLLPGFQGDITQKSNGPLRIQVFNQYQSINRGQNSLYSRLKHLSNFNIDDYIFFFGLRTHDKLDGMAITQLIYVHSKLMIVDDKRAIIGSANINDRSLCHRDSQLAMVIQQDNGNIQGGGPRRKTIFDLRRRLFQEHFGLTQNQTANINDFKIWSKIINNAKKNTLIYRKLFGCYPDDTITVSDQLYQKVQNSDPTLYDELAPQIFAHAVQFPLHFMEDQDLRFRIYDKEKYAGDEAFL